MTDLLDYADRVWRGEESTEAYDFGDLRREGLHDVAPGVWMWPACGNVYIFPTREGLLFFDAGSIATAAELFAAVRTRTVDPLHTVVYSHGHVDHVAGVREFDAESETRGWRRPTVVAHENVSKRFHRYTTTNGYNTMINRRQFQRPEFQWPTVYRQPDVTYKDSAELKIGDLQIQLRHWRGETDDATVAWIPDQRIICSGDFFLWMMPNAGNPQKVQRFALEWANALRWMASLGAEILLPGHGVPIVGADRVRTALTDTAEVLQSLHDQTLDAMNSGATLDQVIHSVTAPPELMRKPYLTASYDEPEFVVRNLWRLYGGWYDGNPANLKPAQRNELAREITELSGGSHSLAQRAGELAARGDLRLAAHLAQIAVDAAPDDHPAHRTRVEVFRALEKASTSTMAKGIYSWAAAESQSVLDRVDLASALSAERNPRDRWTI
ncbi:MBL fold metallo-hydrolase [Rhodococcus sp. SC4]|nr:MBL fold metallo-hydrolase [Rhodococcus sp. SC4]